MSDKKQAKFCKCYKKLKPGETISVDSFSPLICSKCKLIIEVYSPPAPLVGLDKDEIAFLIFKNLCNYSEETARTQWTGKHYVKVEKSIASRTANAICSYFRIPKEIVWPEKKMYPPLPFTDSIDGNTVIKYSSTFYGDGFNNAIDACKAAVEKAKEEYEKEKV